MPDERLPKWNAADARRDLQYRRMHLQLLIQKPLFQAIRTGIPHDRVLRPVINRDHHGCFSSESRCDSFRAVLCSLDPPCARNANAAPKVIELQCRFDIRIVRLKPACKGASQARGGAGRNSAHTHFRVRGIRKNDNRVRSLSPLRNPAPQASCGASGRQRPRRCSRRSSGPKRPAAARRG